MKNPINYSEDWDPNLQDKKMLLSDLNSILPSHNPDLKNEYIDIVKNEKENDLMNYIMNGKQ